jgi:hypothetical protein
MEKHMARKKSWTPGHLSADRQTIYFKIDELWEFLNYISAREGEPWPFPKETFAEDMEAFGMKITDVFIDGKVERRLAAPTKLFYGDSVPSPEDFGDGGLTADPIN